jgi:tetratricopeptide (TPR) repeat protein
MKPPSKSSAAQFTEAMTLLRQGKHAEAETVCLSVLKRDPRHGEALHLAGLLSLQLGHFGEGVARLRRALALKPKDALVHAHLGLALTKRGQNEEALASFERSLGLNPHLLETAMNYGQLLLHVERPADALAVLDRVVARHQNEAEAHHQRGHALFELARLDEALAAHEKALSLNPTSEHYQLGVARALCQLRRPDEAFVFAEQALRLKPDFDLAMLSRAEILLALGRGDEGRAMIEAVMKDGPRKRLARSWLGKLLIASHQPKRALMIVTEDCENAGDDPIPYVNRGTVFAALNQLQEALLSYNHALTLKPNHLEAHYNRAFTLLALGHFEEGWREYEYRLQRPQGRLRRSFHAPPWLGAEPLLDRRLFIYSEQGFGDTIQFARYGIMAADAGAKVTLAVQGALSRLFRDLYPGVTVIDENEAAPEFDLHCPLLSLPIGFATTLENIPAWPGGYITAPADEVVIWRKRLPQGRRRIGLVWSGNTAHSNDANRSIALVRLLPLLRSGDAWVSLQKEVRAADHAALQAAGLYDLTDELTDFADTAALVSALDLVIAVDTSVAHLAAALGKPVWLMLPFASDFRWLAKREDSPWYPGMRLFRQQRPGDWDGVVTRVAAALRI